MSADLQIVRYPDLMPCRTAFIDAHTPGSDQKENYTIIGAGVSESPNQHVHLKETPGFNIGAAAQPARCTNSLHSHRTAEVFIIHSGKWRFFWGVTGDEGELVLNRGDLISLPTHMFRGFENISEPSAANPTGYGFMFAVLGGNDAGGGVVWTPQVLEAAQAHGLILLENGVLVDTNQGEHIPEGLNPIAPLTPEELAFYGSNTIEAEQQVVARQSQSLQQCPIPLVSAAPTSQIQEKPGFEIHYLRWGAQDSHWMLPCPQDTVLICNAGQLWLDATSELHSGDVAFAKASANKELPLSSKQGCELFIVTPTADVAGRTVYV